MMNRQVPLGPRVPREPDVTSRDVAETAVELSRDRCSAWSETRRVVGRRFCKWDDPLVPETGAPWSRSRLVLS